MFDAGGKLDRREYYLKDHLGNTRVVFSDIDENGEIDFSPTTAEVLQTNTYYPFGMDMEGVSAINQADPLQAYKYNGKEQLLGNLYDYGARYYDPSIGRWGAVDPLAGDMPQWSPYCYVFNNPMRLIDPDGRSPDPPRHEASAVMVMHRNSESQSTIVLTRRHRTTYTNDSGDEVVTMLSETQILHTDDVGDVSGFSSSWVSTTSINGKVDKSQTISGCSQDFGKAGDAQMKDAVNLISQIHVEGTKDDPTIEQGVNNLVGMANMLPSNFNLAAAFGKSATSAAASAATNSSYVGIAVSILISAAQSGGGGFNFSNSAVLVNDYMDTGGPGYGPEDRGNVYHKGGSPVMQQSGALYKRDELLKRKDD